MTQAQGAHIGTNPLLPAATAVVAMTLALAIGIGVIGQTGAPAIDTSTSKATASSALVAAERAWQAQREAQSLAFGAITVDPLIAAEREWQRQREQQSGIFGAERSRHGEGVRNPTAPTLR